MKEKLMLAMPPLFSETYAATIAAAARDYPDADGLSIDIHSGAVLLAVAMTDGVIGKWVVESPVSATEIADRRAQLARAGKQYVALTMFTDKLVPLDPTTTRH